MSSKFESYTSHACIDVGKSDGSENPFLVITQGQYGQWVTLSHCWGSVTPAITTAESLSHRCKQIVLGDLPPLNRDAIINTRRFGYHYLWVDSLCILQDSIADWFAEAAEMGGIYRNAVLNISADASPNPDGGIFEGANSQWDAELPLLNLNCGSSKDQIEGSIAIYDCLAQPKIKNPLQERAWVLQERMFSPRKLHHTANEIWRSCEFVHYCHESDPEMHRIIDYIMDSHSIFQMPY